MYKENILLSDIETVKKFVTFANQYKFPVTLFSDKYIINGKSIMGIFGLDLSKPDFKERLKEFSIAAEAV